MVMMMTILTAMLSAITESKFVVLNKDINCNFVNLADLLLYPIANLSTHYY